MRLSRALVAGVLVMTAGIAGCDESTSDTDSLRPVWTSVDLPSGVKPTTFGTDGHRLIIGGRQGSGPWLALLTATGTQRVALHKHSPYSKIAEFVSVGIYQKKIAALGNVHGGAHGNSRWTVWAGDIDALTEYPQSLETFGGVNGGDLAGIVINGDGPLITGSRLFGSGGLDAAVWLPDGSPVGRRWDLQPSAGTDLDSTATVQVSVQSASAAPGQVVLAGSSLHLGRGVHQVATIWDRPDGRHWKRFELPGGGRRSEALSLSCRGDAGADPTCLIAGTVDGRLAAWTLVGDRTSAVTGLPTTSIDPDGPRASVIATPTVRAIAYGSGARTGLMVKDGHRWRQAAGPPGTLVSATGLSTRTYVITRNGPDRRLFVTDLPPSG